jgi:hypothetical protein
VELLYLPDLTPRIRSDETLDSSRPRAITEHFCRCYWRRCIYHRRRVIDPPARGTLSLLFFAGDRLEPPHVHLEGNDGEAKFRLRPVTVASAWGCSARELRAIERIVVATTDEFLGAWHAFFRPDLSRSGTTDRRCVLVEPTPVVGVRFAERRVYLAMEDGREIGAPLAQFPRGAGATDEQRAHWRRIHWPDVAEDFHVAHLLGMSD